MNVLGVKCVSCCSSGGPTPSFMLKNQVNPENEASLWV